MFRQLTGLSIKGLLLLFSGMVIALVLINGGLILWNLQKISPLLDELDATNTNALYAKDMLSSMSDLETELLNVDDLEDAIEEATAHSENINEILALLSRTTNDLDTLQSLQDLKDRFAKYKADLLSLAAKYVDEEDEGQIDDYLNQYTDLLDDLGVNLNVRAEKIIGHYVVAIEHNRERSHGHVNSIVSISAFIIVAVVVGSTIVSLLLAHFIARPIVGVAERMHDVAEGEGDLTITLDAHGTKEVAALARAFTTFAGKIRETVSESKESIGQLATGVANIARGHSDLSRRTERQAVSLSETASTIVEMTAGSKRNADYAQQANQLAMDARNQAENGREMVERLISAMNEIRASGQKVADITSVINEIAFQTNLLALNAAVKAARAGEQGRSFAVVASEVRNLAVRCSKAAKEIQDLIEDSVEKVKEGAELVNEHEKTLERIVNSAKQASEIVAEITTANLAQSTAIEQVNDAILRIDELTRQNAALVVEAASSSELMDQKAIELSELMAIFKEGDELESCDANGTPCKEQAVATGPAPTSTLSSQVAA